MILRNKKGIERNVRLLFELEKKNNRYVIYEDINTLNIYGGKVNKDYLEPLNDKEYKFINDMIEKISE